MPHSNLELYFRSQQVSLQWLPMLRALAMELAVHASPQDLSRLFFNAGVRFAGDTTGRFEGIQTLAQLEENLNDLWARLNWGWVELREVHGVIEIWHHAAPLAEAFGDESLEWSIGLLEGFYECVFKVLGAGDSMSVKGLPGASSGMTVRLNFGR
jgi:hypothetical protein